MNLNSKKSTSQKITTIKHANRFAYYLRKLTTGLIGCGILLSFAIYDSVLAYQLKSMYYFSLAILTAGCALIWYLIHLVSKAYDQNKILLRELSELKEEAEELLMKINKDHG